MPKPIKTLSIQQTELLLDFIRNDHATERARRVTVRNYAITLLMLDAGLRVGEVTRLARGDLVFATLPVQTLTVREEIAKGRHRREVPLSGRLRNAVCRLEQEVWPKAREPEDYYAFPGTKPHSHIASRQVQRMLEHCGDIALGIKVHPHMLRHTFATILMSKTSIRVVQELLGHKSLQSTQIYTHPNSSDLRTAIDSVHPPTGEL